MKNIRIVGRTDGHPIYEVFGKTFLIYIDKTFPFIHINFDLPF